MQFKDRLLPRVTLKHWRGDLFGGLTAAIVALPLALAFGVSSGAGATAGLYGAVCTGFFAALFGGTPSQISGPTGPMTVVMATIFTAVASSDDPKAGVAIAFTIVMLGGLFQIALGALRLGKYITLIPYTVISGFMSGIGIIIILIQIAPFLGFPSDASVIHSAQMIPYEITHPKLFPTSLGILTLIIVFTSPAKVNRVIPSPLLALIICTVISTQFPVDSVARIGEIPQGLPGFHLPVFDFSQLKNMLGYGVILGTLGAIDSLLTSLVADNITHTQHDSDQELIGQGLGNIVAGLCGGLPGAGATMRTVINVRSGGVTSLSGMFHAVVLLVVIFWAAPLTSPIPHAVLAGILIKVGIDIIDWGFLKRAHRISLKAAGLMYGVLFLTVFVDLITAVAVGVFVANMLAIKSLTDLQIENLEGITSAEDTTYLSPREQELIRRAEGRIFLFHLSGPMSFGAARGIAQRMGIIERYEVLILDLLEVPYMGVTASLAIETMIREAHTKGRKIFLVGASEKVRERLAILGILKLLKLQTHTKVTNRLEALEQAIAFIEDNHHHAPISPAAPSLRE